MADQSSQSGVELAPGVFIARTDLQYTFARSGGPGGQAVNKLATKAQLRVAINAIRGLDHAAATRLRALAGKRLTESDEILLQAETHRSQFDNKNLALDRLGDLIRKAMIKPKVRKKKKPSRSMIEKRLAGKRLQSQKKQDRRGKRIRNSGSE